MIQTAELESGGSDPAAEADPLPEVKPEAPEANSEAASAPTPDPTPDPGVTQQAQVGQVSGYKVQLAAVQDASAAEREWRRLQGLHPELLGNLTLFTETVEIEGRGTFHRIQAGPLPSRETAADLCDVLKGREQPCLVVSP
jgi:cell division septation protein DedD